MTYRLYWCIYWRLLLCVLVWAILALWGQAHQGAFVTYSDGGVWDGF